MPHFAVRSDTNVLHVPTSVYSESNVFDKRDLENLKRDILVTQHKRVIEILYYVV